MVDDARLAIASTPLVALLAVAAVLGGRGRSTLVLIEDFPDAARWRDVLASRGVFDDVVLLPGRVTEASLASGGHRLARERLKREIRRATFARLRAIDDRLRPTRVLLGNDRRPEMQYALHLASKRGAAPGVYLDDGLFSYVGDVHDRPLARIVDGVLKKLAYGAWWQGLAAAGSSRWIGEARLAYPALADPRIRGERFALDPAAFRTRAFLRVAAALSGELGPRRYDALVVLPHSRLWQPSLREAIVPLLPGAAVKYHPRETDADALDLGARGATLLPTGLAVELAFRRLRRGATVYGEASTALLAARWLRPDLRVVDLRATDGDFARRASALLERTGVEQLDRPRAQTKA